MVLCLGVIAAELTKADYELEELRKAGRELRYEHYTYNISVYA
jgi:hypothetical protein